MAVLKFEDLSFREEKDKLIVMFLKIFRAEIDKKDLLKIGKFKVNTKSIEFDASDNKANRSFNILLSSAFSDLVNTVTLKKTIYVHMNSGIPLIGNGGFGIVDRNTSLIEIKPITGCNICCIYCSVDQDKRNMDFVVEERYLVEELKELVKKKSVGVEVHIGTQGEPLLYAPLVELIRDVSSIEGVKKISMDTNGVMITKSKADELIDAGLSQFNLSINAIEPEIAKRIAGGTYKIEKVVEIAEYISSKTGLIITPVYLPGINDSEIPKLIELSKRLGCKIGIQNFLTYRFGRNPVKADTWDNFYSKMKKWEKDSGIKLVLSEEDFDIVKTKGLEKPFKKGDVVKAKIVCEGRMKNEKIAVSDGRTITVSDVDSRSKDIKIKITRDKHNIFYGVKV